MNTIGTVRGTEAETIALVVGGSIGLDTGNPSASTIQQRHGNSALRYHPVRTRKPRRAERRLRQDSKLADKWKSGLVEVARAGVARLNGPGKVKIRVKVHHR